MQTEDTSDVALSSTTPVSEEAANLETERATQPWHRITLGCIVFVSAFLNLFRLDQVGYGNLYYAAAVKSMLQSWHNFFFVSFDPGGFVTVDKPPLGLWIQTASAKIFGFSGLSLLIPEALASVLSVALLYYLVRKVVGPVAGLLAALALALMPISVVTARNNAADSLLVLTLLVALLMAPTIWSIVSVIQGSNSSLPIAGPIRQGAGRGLASLGSSGGFGEQADPKLIQYLETNQGNTRYILATMNATSAAPIIISTSKPVMALGGFLGSDPILTPQKLAALVEDGTVRYFMLPSLQLNNLSPTIREYLESQGLGNIGGFGGLGGGENTQWVTSHCKTVPTNLYSSINSSNSSGQPPFGNGQPPFDGGSGSGQPPFGNGQPPFGGGSGSGNGQGQPSFGGGMQQQLYDCAGAHRYTRRSEGELSDSPTPELRSIHENAAEEY